jgi:precorrin-2 dehydrogenase/sirohydrochlorin ferrochelatase
MTPVYLNPDESRKIVVFGGGKVASRKIAHFEGFRIVTVSREILPEVAEMSSETVVADIDEKVVREHIADAFMVMAATDSKKLNAMIGDIAKERGIPVNSAHGGGDILIPSTIRKRNYSVAVSSEGKAPAFPPYLVKDIEKILDDRYDLMMDLLIKIRPEVMEKIPEQPDRASALAAILENGEIWDLLSKGRTDEAYESAEITGGLK